MRLCPSRLESDGVSSPVEYPALRLQRPLYRPMNIFGLNISWGNGGAFEGAKPSRSRGVVPGPRPVDAKRELTEMTRNELVKNARYLDRNSGLVRSQSRDMQLYAVGCGLKARAVTTDKA